MMIVEDDDEIVAVAVPDIAAAVAFESDTLYVVVQTDIAQVAQVQVIEVANGDLYAYGYLKSEVLTL